jgi:DNA invertase Pin-like site-specific DNA recombinase
LDTSRENPAARLQLHVLAAVCEFERSLIRDRVKAGMARAKALGRLQKRRPRGLAKGMESKIRRAAVIVAQDPAITVADLAREIGVAVGTAHRIRRAVRQTPAGEVLPPPRVKTAGVDETAL